MDLFDDLPEPTSTTNADPANKAKVPTDVPAEDRGEKRKRNDNPEDSQVDEKNKAEKKVFRDSRGLSPPDEESEKRCKMLMCFYQT